jgi:hypothetical protein
MVKMNLVSLLLQSSTQVTTPSSSQPAAAASQPSNGAGLAAVAALAAVVAFAAGRLFTGGPTLATLEQMSVPLDVALTNGKPTVMEFYADWWDGCTGAACAERFLSNCCGEQPCFRASPCRCEVCQSLVPDEYAVEQAYGDR